MIGQWDILVEARPIHRIFAKIGILLKGLFLPSSNPLPRWRWRDRLFFFRIGIQHAAARC